jgi:hypothetical protein
LRKARKTGVEFFQCASKHLQGITIEVHRQQILLENLRPKKASAESGSLLQNFVQLSGGFQ